MDSAVVDALPTVSVIVCAHTWDRYELIHRCVRSVLTGDALPLELIVVIDDEPSLLDALRVELRGDVTVIPSAKRGAPEAKNTGVEIAQGDIVAFLDDDAAPDRDWLTHIQHAFASDPQLLGIGGHLRPDWEDPSGPLPDEVLWVVGSIYRGHRLDRGPIGAPIGANMAFRRHALQAVEGFPSEFGPVHQRKLGLLRRSPSTGEELVTALKIEAAFGPGRIQYLPRARARHYAPRHRTTWRYVVSRCRAEGGSKAEIERRYGTSSLGRERSYLTRVLAPGVVRYSLRWLRTRDSRDARDASVVATVAVVTCGSYALSRAAIASVSFRHSATRWIGREQSAVERLSPNARRYRRDERARRHG